VSRQLTVFFDDRRAVHAAHTGIGTYARLLLHGLAKRDDVELIRATSTTIAGRRVVRSTSQAARLLGDQAVLPFASRNTQIYHAVWHEGSPLLRTPLVLSVHDLDIVSSSSRYSRLQRLYYGGLLSPLIHRARVVMVPSRFTADELARWRPGARIVVVPYAVDPVFFSGRSADAAHVLAQRGLKAGSYALYTGGVHARKALPTLFAGVARFQRRMNDVPTLAVTGPAGEEARGQANRAGCRTVFTGVLDVQELHALYSEAALVVSASVNEGFGYTAAEALATGCPLVCPDAGALPETGGSWSLKFPAGDIDALATTMEQAVRTASGQAGRLAEAQQDARNRFSVDRAAEAAVRCYHAALSPRLQS
jgi:glycosyltransferase involved in cell wall biosynthesis